MKSKFTLYGYAFMSAVLLWLATPPLPFFFLMFIAFIPFLIIEREISKSKLSGNILQFFFPLYFGLLLWNLLATWWIVKSTLAGALLAITVNPLLMSLPFLFFHLTKKHIGEQAGHLSLIVYYLTFEYLHQQWELAWPWLNLGICFAKFPQLFQWYEYTGTSGGSLWILTMNVLFFQAWENRKAFAKISSLIFKTALVILFPVAVSLFMYFDYREEGEKINISIVQPNFDPYQIPDEKSDSENLQRLFELSETGISDSTDFLVFPEAVLPGKTWLNNPNASELFREAVDFARKKNITLLTGALTMKEYYSRETSTARNFSNGECCYDIFNSALQIEAGKKLQVYHKSKLVPGVERIPYPALFRILEPWAVHLGGISGSLGIQTERTVFFSNDSTGIAPLICYESVFGEYVSKFIRNGAQAIFIITNDGWWGDTPGYKQHLAYASLRAVETRRSMARAANNGISCFINQRGDILQATDYSTAAVISGNISLNESETFYVKYGDYIGRISGFISMFLLLTAFVRRKTNPLKNILNN